MFAATTCEMTALHQSPVTSHQSRLILTSTTLAALPPFHDQRPGTAPPTRSPHRDPPPQSDSSRQSVLSTPHTGHPAPAACHSSVVPSSPPNSAATGSTRAARPPVSAPRRMPYTQPPLVVAA